MEYRIITAPVIIPNKPDCDQDKGEPPLTKQQVQNLKETYENYKLIDYDHNITDPSSTWYQKTVGEPIKSWITKKPTTYTNILGKTETIPSGTWWLTSKITDPEMIKLIDEKLVTAYSISVGNKEFCDRFIQQLQLAPKNNTNPTTQDTDGLIAFKTTKTLIKDIINPVSLSISLTGLPCVGSATFSQACYDKNQDNNLFSNKNGGQQMTETEKETRFSVSELLGLQKLFANKKDEEPSKDKGDNKGENEESSKAPKKAPEEANNKFVTKEEFDEKIKETTDKIDEIDTKIEKILEKLDPEEKEEKEDEGKEGQNVEEEQGNPTANKNNPPQSSQLDNTDDANNLNNTANKNNSTTKAKIMNALNRKGNGEYKFPRTH